MVKRFLVLSGSFPWMNLQNKLVSYMKKYYLMAEMYYIDEEIDHLVIHNLTLEMSSVEAVLWTEDHQTHCQADVFY